MAFERDGLHGLAGRQKQKQRHVVQPAVFGAEPQNLVLHSLRLQGKGAAGEIDKPLLLIAQANAAHFLHGCSSPGFGGRRPVLWT